MIKKFASYYKPYLGLFSIDMLCALFIAAVDLVYPLISKYALEELLPNNQVTAFYVFMGILVAAYLLREQGFDLTQYAGKRVKRYTYEIYNYPSGEAGVQANLLIHKNTVIGGEVLSPRLNGFLHGLAMP